MKIYIKNLLYQTVRWILPNGEILMLEPREKKETEYKSLEEVPQILKDLENKNYLKIIISKK